MLRNRNFHINVSLSPVMLTDTTFDLKNELHVEILNAIEVLFLVSSC